MPAVPHGRLAFVFWPADTGLLLRAQQALQIWS